MDTTDYRKKYLELKSYVVHQRGAGKVDQEFIERVPGLHFVSEGRVIGNDVKTIMMSLIESFNQIATLKIPHNLEISQYHTVDRDNYEIVLRYIDTTVCVSNGNVLSDTGITENNGKYYQNGHQIECKLSRGLVRFFLRRKNGDTYVYHPIYVVDVQNVESLANYANEVYYNNERIRELENAAAKARSIGQSNAIASAAKSERLNTSAVKSIVESSKEGAVAAQTAKMNTERVISAVPSKEATESAMKVAETIVPQNKNVMAVIVPGNQPIAIQPLTSNVPSSAFIGGNGITTDMHSGSERRKRIATRAALAIDAKLAIVPRHAVPSTSDIGTQLSDAAKTASQSAKTTLVNVVDETGNGVDSLLKLISQGLGDAADWLKEFVNGNVQIVKTSEDGKVGIMTPVTETANTETVGRSKVASVNSTNATANAGLTEGNLSEFTVSGLNSTVQRGGRMRIY